MKPRVSEERYRTCKGAAREGGRKAMHEHQAPGCCICLTAADEIDTEHSERGFATGGTLLKVEEIARQNGIAPGVLWSNADEAIVRYLMMQQRAFVADANGSSLSRWHSPFSVDVGFGADGKAWAYDSHLLPTWKRAGHWKNRHLDRGNALGLYSSMMLAMSHILVNTDAVDELHRPLLSRADAVGRSPELLEFLRDQGFASMLGFRRAWPSPHHERLVRIASSEDARFAALLERMGLLLPSMDALHDANQGSLTRRRVDLLLQENSPLRAFSGKLYANESKPAVCEDAPKMLEAWRAAAEGSGDAARSSSTSA